MLVRKINKFYKENSNGACFQIDEQYLYNESNCRKIIKDIKAVLSEMEQTRNLTQKDFSKYRKYHRTLGEVRMFINRKVAENEIVCFWSLPKWD